MNIVGVAGRVLRARSVTDVSAVTLAAATWLGVVVARPVPVAVGAAVVALAFALPRSWLLVVGAGLLGTSLAAAAWAGLVPVAEGTYTGAIRLVADPDELGGAARTDVALDDGRRVEAWARGEPASWLRGLLAGERVTVTGRLQPLPDDASWTAPRHLVGRLTITSVAADVDRGPVWDRLANDYHRLLSDGAQALPAEQRPLLLGFVLGDDRGQDPAVVSDFRDAGLSHLLVVSGENVAFVLALAAPIVSRLRLSMRLVLTLVVLAWFALLSRVEPSVLRATFMAGVAAVASYRGRQLSGLRVLALAVTLLLLVDPLLQGALGFRLSVAASAAIVVLARPLADRLPGPAWLRRPSAVALAAQLGVAPVLIPAFGGMPLLSIGANLLAVPAAGPVMMWGLVAGPVAGVLRAAGAPVLATGLLFPIRLLLGWVAAVARAVAALPLGSLGWFHLVALALVGGGYGVAVRRRQPWGRAVAVGASVAVLLTAALVRLPAPNGPEAIAGVDLWRATATVLVVPGSAGRPDAVLDGLRSRGVGGIDVLIVTTTGRQSREVVQAIRSRLEVATLWQPDGGRVPDAITPRAGDRLDASGLRVEVRAVRPALVVDVRLSPGAV